MFFVHQVAVNHLNFLLSEYATSDVEVLQYTQLISGPVAVKAEVTRMYMIDYLDSFENCDYAWRISKDLVSLLFWGDAVPPSLQVMFLQLKKT